MDHYLDIELRPDPEFAAPQLMNALFAKLHRALVTHGHGQTGVSFPGLNPDAPHLGTRLRLHAAAPVLQSLSTIDWLRGMNDHVRLYPIAPVPTQAQHRVVSRVQADSNPARLRRRMMRRHNLTEAAALAQIPDGRGERLQLPYVQLRSLSTGQNFRLFLSHGPLLATPVPGDFSAYGLSQAGTVPWF